jgi:hypothetical protein
MSRRRSSGLFSLVFLFGTAAALSACSHADAVSGQTAATPQTAAEPAPAAFPITREQASTDCWMKYDKEARHLSLDQKLPLVEKCTAEKLKAKGAAR